MREQLFERKTALRRMMAAQQFAQVRIARRPMHHRQRIEQRWQFEIREHGRGNPVADSRSLGFAQRHLDQRTKPRLRYAFGGRVDRRQDFLERRGFLPDPAIFRMDDFEAQRTAPHFAETANARTARKIGLLRA